MDYMAKFWSPFTRINTNSSNKMYESKAVGLKILITSLHITTTNTTNDPNSIPIFQRNQIPSSQATNNYSSLHSCFLCHKHLALNKDVFMYRGDQGFCSQECRSRQIYIDDLASLEFIKKRLRNADGRCSSRSLNRDYGKSSSMGPRYFHRGL